MSCYSDWALISKLLLVWTAAGEVQLRCPLGFSWMALSIFQASWFPRGSVCRPVKPKSTMSLSVEWIRSWSCPCCLPDLVSNHFPLLLAPATLASVLLFLNKLSSHLPRALKKQPLTCFICPPDTSPDLLQLACMLLVFCLSSFSPHPTTRT